MPVDLSHPTFETPDCKQPVRIVQLSDLHYGPYIHAGHVRNWVALTNAAKPDLIIISGDFVDRMNLRSLTPLANALSQLRAPLGVWAVWGNHDHKRYPDIQKLRTVLEKAGVQFLVNAGVQLRDDLFLAGVDDRVEATPDVMKALKDCPPQGMCVLVSHNPDVLPTLPEAAITRVTLALSGHTHGGQIRLPLVGALRTSSLYGQRFLGGWSDAPVPAYVSRGLGMTFLPLRINCPPELVMMQINPQTNTTNQQAT